MFANLHRKSLSLSLGLLLTGASAGTWAASALPAVDAGTAPANQTVHVTLILKLHNQAALEDYIRQTVTPGSAHYQQFLTPQQFAQQYGATDAEVARVQSYLQSQGLSSTVLPGHLAIRTSGTLSQFGKLFQTSVHNYVSRQNGHSFHKPVTALQIPSSIADVVDVATGLSSEKVYRPHHVSSPALASLGAPNVKLNAQSSKGSSGSSSNPTASGVPGEYTVGDVANFYNINPLYHRGVVGKGSTVGIVTLSNFYPSDATAYWSDIGLTTKPNRITQVHVDGGAAIDGGSGETSIDVEQSGGIAPFANIIVYDAPNTTDGYVDAFAQAVSDDIADSISTSWGLPEIFNFAALNVAGASNTDTSDAGDLRAFHKIFLEAAVQGQSLFAASGDSGAYDTVRDLGAGTGVGQYTAPLTVDSPASDPYITAAGGTTTPYSYQFGTGPTESVTQESVWGWDYLQNYFNQYVRPINLFSSGGGGGVSVYWHEPFYQAFTWGIRRSEPNQSLVFNDPSAGPTTLLQLPSHFAGRNVPDISLNADPETGYIFVSTVDGGLASGEGGTSFVAPQLNGITALLRQSTGHRIGLWNPQVYALQNIFGYGFFSPFNSVRAGDNWFYYGAPRYNQGAGIGSLNVANLDVFLRSGF
ncbi:S53 family peptidase [Dyella nitratireducens]|uniref:Aspartyl protease n=1 Tax=Dyella nitratireducens TaxID=1849580 RepID=A0ABQ1FZ76_9GAMM|nr:S53 family peptidase [Dyella nitratireducens]GGA34342.1 aspartyl protease [Dyella nitratireducens]GLQ40852.1 aspartyl protease [Dyella nitratireducens]